MVLDREEHAFAVEAAAAWRSTRRALLDPEQAFEETYGRPPTAALEVYFAEFGVPFRDYNRDGSDWVREVESPEPGVAQGEKP